MTDKILLLGCVSACASFLTACTSPAVITAEYVMPPASVKDIKSIDTLSINTHTRLTGNAVTENDKSYASGALQQRLAARLCQEGFYRVTDFVWGNVEGASKMGRVLAKKKSRHGYSGYMTDSDFKRANLNLVMNVQIDREKVRKNLPFTLKTVPYKTEYVGKVPVGRPMIEATKMTKQVVPVDVEIVKCSGSLSVKLTDKNGRVVYKKNFPGLKYTCEITDTKREPLPSNMAIIAQMTQPALEQLVADLSPHKEKRSLTVNNEGDIRAVRLLEAQAFTEAIAILDEIEEKSYADYENLALAYEVIGEYHAAQEAFQEALKRKADSPIAVEGSARVKNVLAGKTELRKKNVKRTGTQFKTPEFQ